MSPLVLALVATAAVAHAGWNLLAKGAEGGAAFAWLTALAGSIVYVPVLVAALRGTGAAGCWPRAPSCSA